eukprot:COSAG01_NODE_2071_length_8496_cov_5.773252_2_plen_76_part_00
MRGRRPTVTEICLQACTFLQAAEQAAGRWSSISVWGGSSMNLPAPIARALSRPQEFFVPLVGALYRYLSSYLLAK